jgi:ABC-type bacteriocin/lantibiotic exporter with double-glycine peptidase domain
VNRRPLLIDLGIALVIAIVIVLISPGWAVTALIAIVVLAGWSVDALVRRWRWNRRPPRR